MLIVIDVDGTLLTSTNCLTQGTRLAIRRVLADGHELMLASARSPRSLAATYRDLGVAGMAIAYSGALAVCISEDWTWTCEVEHLIDPPVGRAIVGAARRLFVNVAWYRYDVAHVTQQDHWWREESRLSGDQFVDDPGLHSLSEHCHKLLCIGRMDRVCLLEERVCAPVQNCLAVRSKPNYLEVLPPGTDKGATLRLLSERMGYRREDVVAIGDGLNDIGMLSFAGNGVAMGNAHPKLLAAADTVTATNDSDGVAAFLLTLVECRP